MKPAVWSGMVLHTAGGAALTTAGLWIGVPGWMCLVVISWGGWLREVFQHDLRLTPHQALEAGAWSLGSALAWVAVGWIA